MKYIVLLCYLFFQSPLWAQDHLEPEDSIYEASRSEYHLNVAKVLGSKLPYDLPKVIVIPSNQREYIVGIAPEAPECSIVSGRAELLLWTYEVASSEPRRRRELLRGYPSDPLDVPVSVQRRRA